MKNTRTEHKVRSSGAGEMLLPLSTFRPIEKAKVVFIDNFSASRFVINSMGNSFRRDESCTSTTGDHDTSNGTR